MKVKWKYWFQCIRDARGLEKRIEEEKGGLANWVDPYKAALLASSRPPL